MIFFNKISAGLVVGLITTSFRVIFIRKQLVIYSLEFMQFNGFNYSNISNIRSNKGISFSLETLLNILH